MHSLRSQVGSMGSESYCLLGQLNRIFSGEVGVLLEKKVNAEMLM